MALAFFDGRFRGADEGSDDRTAGGILRERGEDLRVEPRVGQDPEVFGKVKVGVPVAADQAHEAQVRNVLHRREREDRLVAAQQVLAVVFHGPY